MKCFYIVEGWEDRLFEDEGDACEFIGEIEDFYTDEGLQEMCQDQIYEICGITELLEHFDYDMESVLDYYTQAEIDEYKKELHEQDEIDIYIENQRLKNK